MRNETLFQIQRASVAAIARLPRRGRAQRGLSMAPPYPISATAGLGEMDTAQSASEDTHRPYLRRTGVAVRPGNSGNAGANIFARLRSACIAGGG
jgi:hypothetical protein